MLISGTGRHRRAYRRSTRRLATALATLAGTSLMLPLVSASGAMAVINHKKRILFPSLLSLAPSVSPKPDYFLFKHENLRGFIDLWGLRQVAFPVARFRAERNHPAKKS